MLVHPQFDAVAVSLGPLAIRWYGLMYVVGFIAFILLGRLRVKQSHIAAQGWTIEELEDFLFYGVLGVVIGGRLGYVLFYKPSHFLAHPAEIIQVWQGGMAFHGGLLGVLAAMWVFARKRGRTFLQIGDMIAPLVLVGFGMVRLGNFINGELWGRPVIPPDSLPWAMIFPQAGDGIARHPSQLYQALLEGVLLLIIMWWYSSKPRAVFAKPGAVSGLFLLGYGLQRFLVEFTREPDNFLGLLAMGLSMGQWLSVPMIIGGIGLLIWAYGRKQA
ncbi:prolipoprotein diacylglyceryl transferase [Ampullimonas aquatilis]|uniref:prolipoprotein diacylglyceryl transferase n=1 Tax=Ampullimonas aquatilis TaxID=1341549 RepID=UPI003C78EDF5